MKGSAEGAKTMNETKPKTKIKKEFFFFRNGSVFELIAKCVVMLLIPYVLLFLLGIILDRGLDVVAGSDFWPIAIFALVFLLELVALVLSAIAIVKFCRKRRKPKAEREAAKMRRKAEKRKAEKAAEESPDKEDNKQGETHKC